jgi:hypothetical protein
VWNRYDICEAWYTFAADWHQGQNSPEYQIFGRLSRLGFKMRPYSGHPLPKTDSGDFDNARVILAGLIRRARKGWRPRAH